jgi:hypothetical protein
VKYTPLVLLWFFYIQNIIMASTSVQFLWKKKSKDLALIMMGFIFGLTLLGFLYIEVSEKDPSLRLGYMSLLLCLLVLIVFFSFTSSSGKLKKPDTCIQDVQKEIRRNTGATLVPNDKK